MSTSFDDLFYLASLVSLVASLIALAVALTNDRRRRTRNEFRRVLQGHLKTPSHIIEKRLADLVFEALVSNNVTRLRSIDLEEFLESYIADTRFRPNFYTFLLQRFGVSASEIHIKKDILQKALSIIEGWKGYDDQRLQSAVEAYFRAVDIDEAKSRRINLFIKSKDKYFKEKILYFVNDIETILSAASIGSTLPVPEKLRGPLWSLRKMRT